MKGRMLVVFFLFLFAGSVAAQLDVGNIMRVRVRLVFANGACETSTRVTLIGNGGPVAEGMTNDQCEVDFFNVPKGNYQPRVSGRSFADADLGSINLTFYSSAVRGPGEATERTGSQLRRTR